MANVNRRDAVKWAAGLAVGAGTTAAPAAQEPTKKPAADTELAEAIKGTHAYMFAEEITFKTSVTARHSFDLVITSARDPIGTFIDGVHIRPGTSCVFRANTEKDEFTKKGGLYWKCGEATGKVKFATPGPLVLAVREHDGTVRLYPLVLDLRC